jgi:hypothetical protein
VRRREQDIFAISDEAWELYEAPAADLAADHPPRDFVPDGAAASKTRRRLLVAGGTAVTAALVIAIASLVQPGRGVEPSTAEAGSESLPARSTPRVAQRVRSGRRPQARRRRSFPSSNNRRTDHFDLTVERRRTRSINAPPFLSSPSTESAETEDLGHEFSFER